MQKSRLVLAFLVLIAALPGRASASWWNNDWQYRKQITLDLAPTGADIAGSATDVPLLIRLHTANFNFFNDIRADGADLRFVASDDVTPLKFHLEKIDPANQMAMLWVRVPRLTGATNTDFIYLYYGNAKAVAGGDAAATYDTNATLVYHFTEGAKDATAYANEPARVGAVLNPTSLIGGGAAFDGTNAIALEDKPSLRVVPNQGATVSAWVKFDQPQGTAAQEAYLVSAQDATGRGLVLGVNGVTAFARLGATGAPQAVSPPLSTGEWHHLALRAGNGKLAIVVDGAEAATVDAPLTEITAPFVIGQSAAGTNGFVGEIDELQIANTARSNDWLKAAATSQGTVTTLAAYGGDASRDDAATGGEEGYFKSTLRNVTFDGWVVIGVLMVMFVIAVFVIVMKALLLSRVERENRRFLAAYRRLGADDPLALAASEKEDANLDDDKSVEQELSGHSYRPSTLFPLYLAGVVEVRHRLQSPAVGAQRRGFSAESIGTIRATVDAALVRERQKLNNKMVLLTIAISGGPYLGLLGTVVGVMITFAAIAASGDVNINAIAPGIAAALVATVAGLGVAIPALFAYNWLGARIKDIDAETHVFADQFVNKLAEHFV